MRVRTDYKICPFCGASLDIGETCDCEEATTPLYVPNRPLNVLEEGKGGRIIAVGYRDEKGNIWRFK